LDAVVGIGTEPGGRPGSVEYAHLLPADAKQSWETHRFDRISDVDIPFEDFIRELEGELQRKARVTRESDGTPALLVHVDLGETDANAREREMLELCRTAGVHVVDVEGQRRSKPDPKFVVGKGKIEEIELRALELGAELLIFSRDLSPAQSRAITDRTDIKVVHRTQLILDLFAQRASTYDGKLQVELAQLKYTLPKLIQKNTAMSRLT